MELLGVVLALITAFLWALTSVAMRRATMELSPLAASAIASLVGVLMALAGSLTEFSAERRLPAIGEGAAEAMAAGILVFGLGRLFWYYGISKIGASRSNAIAASESVVAPLTAVAIAGESLHLIALSGCVMIALGVAVVSWQRENSFDHDWTRGVIASIGAALAFALGATFARVANLEIGSPFLTYLISTSTSLLVVLPMTIFTGGVSRALRNRFALIGSAANGTASLSFWGALYLTPVSIAVPLSQTFPLFTLLITLSFAKALERVDSRTVAGALTVTLGAFLVGWS
ncbi:MAG: DMT family transporter [Thaumarchaeota archaeon]|nr:DMT family transporter [Candidatus Calditenuaceae archaeon]MDW8186614.1 DMT family transporter [Nitrososphaerota archaeon]